jgi:hypothetical protein
LVKINPLLPTFLHPLIYGAIYKTDEAEEWINSLLKSKLGSSSELLLLESLLKREFLFVLFQRILKQGGTQVLDEFITPDMSVAKATVMSMSIPLIFRSHEIGDNEILINAETNTFLPRGIYSDGAIRNGLPIAAFSNELADGQNVVGFYLKKNHLEVEEIISQIPNFALRTIMGYLLNHPFFRDLSYSIKSLLSHYYNPKDAKGKIYIVEGNISASLLNDSVITADERAGLKSVGSKAAENFFPTIFKDFKDVRSELRSFDDGSTIISTDIGLEKWNVTNAKQRLLSLSEGTHEIDGFIEQLNFDLRNQRGQVFTAEVINTLIAAIQARMPHVGLTVDGNVVTVAPQREKQINFLSLEQGLDQFEGRKKVFIGGPSNVMSDYRPSIPTIRALLENLQKNDPNVVIVLGTTAFGYGQQAAKIAKELGLTTVSVLPRNHGVWASPSDIDFHVTGGIDWTGRHYYEAISAFADAIFTVEGFGGTRKEFQAFRDAGKKAFRIRTDLTAEENNLEDHAKLALDPNASATEINTAAEWGALSQADALNQVRVRYAAKINSALESDSAVSSVDFMRDYYSQLGKKDKTVQHQARQDILSAYGLLNADGSLNYDAFYSEIILNASNQDKNAWLKDYEAVVAFIDEIEYRITKDEVRDFAFAIHDGGYWLDRLKEIQSTIISEPGHLLLGRIPQFQSQAEENEFLSYLNAEGQKAYASRFENAGGYKLTLAHLEENKRLEFYQKYGSLKDQASLKAYLDSGKFNAAKVQVFNANAGSWNDLLGDVAFFDNLTPAEASRLASLESRDAKEAYLEEIGKTSRLSAIRSNQTGGMASAFALKNIKSKSLKFAEIDYATAVIWRYKGHWSGLNAFEEVYQVNTDYYSNEFDADRLKDGPIWQAVLDRELELQGITNENERFLQVVVRRTDNQSALDYKSSDDAMQKMIAPVREQVRQDFKSDPEKMARLALVSHDLGYWPDQKNNIANPSHAALGRAPDLEGEQLQKFKSFLTSDGQTLYETRFAKPSGYKLLVKHVKEDQRENFYQFMAELYQLDKSELIGNIGSLKEGTQVFNANYGSWEDLEKDISKFDAESGDGSRIAQMLENQISNIIMTRILSSTDSFLTGMQMSHAMAILWRYVVADYKGIRAYDGKDKFGQYDPKWKHDGSEQVRTNYYNPAFAEDRGKDFEMWSSLLIELARIDGKTENAAVTEQVVRRSSNESEIAWQSTMRPIVKRVDEVEASITQEDLAKFAPGVHNNGYWAKEKSKIGTVENPSSDSLLGSHLDVQGLIENAFHPEARKWWDGKHTKSVIDEYNALSNEEKQNLKVKFGVVRLGTKGYQFNGAIFKNEAARKQFYASLPNKTASAVEGSATAVILNENAMSFENAWKEADLYKGADAEDRKSRLYGNQKGAIATALVLADTEGLSLEEMAYLTAVIWRYKGHWSGDKGYQSEWQVSRDYLMGLDRAEREKDVSILLAVLEILGKAAPISRGRLDDGAVATDLLDKDGLPLDIETDLDLQLQDRVYLKIDGKWYAGTITDYRGDGLLDGRYSKEGYWQISGYMVKLDGQVPGWALPLNNLFLTNEDLNNERKKEQLTERVVFKISKADSNNDLAILDTVSVGRAALRESLSSRIEERVFRSEMRMSSLSSSDLNFLMQREWAVAGGVFFRYGFEEAYEALSAKHVGVFKDVVLAVSADEATGRASITVSLATDSQAPLTATQNAFATELTGLLQQFSDHLGSTAATAILTRQVTRQDSNVPADNNAMWSTVRLDFSPRNELRSRGDAVLADFKKLGFEKKLLDDKALKFTSIERVDMLSMEAAIRSIVDLGDDTIDAREVFDILSLVLTQDILKYFTIGTSFEALRGIALDLLSSKTVQNPVFYSKGRLQLVFAALISLRDLGKMIDLSRNTSSEEYIILLDKARSAVPMPDIRLAILAESNTVLKEREVAFRKDLLYKNDYDVILDYIRKSIPVEDGPAVIEAVLALEEQIKPFKGQMAFKVNPLTPLLTPIPGDSDAVIHAKLILSAKKNRGGTSVMNPNAYILGVDFDLKKALSNYFDPTIPERFKQTPQDAVALEKLGSFLSAMEQAVTQGQLPSYYSRAIDELRRRISAGVGLAEATVDLQTLLEKNIFPRQSNGYTEPPTQKDLAEAQRANDSRVTWLANFHDAVRSEMRDFKTSEEAIDYALKTPNNNWDWRREPSTKKVMALSLIEGSSVDANKAREILAVALKNNIYDGKIPDGTRAALNFALASVQGDFEEANLTRRAIAFALGTLSGDDSAGREGYDASLKALGDALIDSFRSRTIGASDAFETLAAAIASVPSDNASDAVVNELTESLIEILSNSNLSESNADSTASALANIDRDVNEKTGLLILDRLVEVQGNSRESNQRRANFAASLNPTLTLDNYINAIFSNSANVDLAISKILETLSKINQTQEDSMGRGYSAIGKTIALFLALEHGGLLEALSASQRVRIKTALENVLTNKFDVVLSDDQHYRNSKWVVDEVLKLLADIEKSALENQIK